MRLAPVVVASRLAATLSLAVASVVAPPAAVLSPAVAARTSVDGASVAHARTGGVWADGATAAAAPAQASGAVLPRPRADEWWFADWSIQSRVWPLTTGRGVIVAVLDSGVQANVPDLRGAVLSGGDTTGAGTKGTTDGDYAKDGHGTAMAALIAGQGRGTGMVGIAPDAKILPVRVTGKGGDTPEATAAGIRFAVQHGAQVINMSLAIPSPFSHQCGIPEQEAVDYALAHNVVLVASAGNSRQKGNPPEEPASCAGVLAVGAVNPSLTIWPESERQPYVAVAAPGNQIGWSGRDGRYFPDGFGTSQAAAFVSGEAALVRARYPSMPWQQVVQRIIGTALHSRPVPNPSYGYGIVRIAGAVDVSRYPVPTTAPNPVYLAYRHWLASPLAKQLARQNGQHPDQEPAAGPAPSGGSSIPAAAAVAGVAAVAVVAMAVLLVLLRRRRRRHAGAGPSTWRDTGF